MLSPRSVSHSRAAFRIACLFEDHLTERDDFVISFGTDLYLSEDTRFIPDAMVVRERGKLKPSGVYGAPDLVVEVLSPGSALKDKGYKKNAYGKYGVREYWLVDIPNRSVEQYLLDGNSLELHDIHTILDEIEMERLSEEERAAYSTAFQCSLYDDLTIHLEDVFSKLI